MPETMFKLKQAIQCGNAGSLFLLLMEVGTKWHRYTKAGIKTSKKLSGVVPVASVFFGVETNLFFFN